MVDDGFGSNRRRLEFSGDIHDPQFLSDDTGDVSFAVRISGTLLTQQLCVSDLQHAFFELHVEQRDYVAWCRCSQRVRRPSGWLCLIAVLSLLNGDVLKPAFRDPDVSDHSCSSSPLYPVPATRPY